MGSPPVLTSETLARNKKEMSFTCKLCLSAHIHPPLQINSNPHKLSLKMRLYNDIPLTFASQITIHKFTNNRYICDPSSVGALLVAPHLHKWRETMVSTHLLMTVAFYPDQTSWGCTRDGCTRDRYISSRTTEMITVSREVETCGDTEEPGNSEMTNWANFPTSKTLIISLLFKCSMHVLVSEQKCCWDGTIKSNVVKHVLPKWRHLFFSLDVWHRFCDESLTQKPIP
jgi:hypothetical protein